MYNDCTKRENIIGIAIEIKSFGIGIDSILLLLCIFCTSNT